MILKLASAKAIRHACLNFHYAKAVPSVRIAFSVFNDDGEWCGVVAFGSGANNNLAKSVGQPQGAAVELVRVALNGKQSGTGKVLSIALKILPKYAPLLRCVVSYADPEQGHLGVLYQATNWAYLGASKAQREVYHPVTGAVLHKRSANALFGTIKGLQKTPILWKHKYVYPLTRQAADKIEKDRKPYPKALNAD